MNTGNEIFLMDSNTFITPYQQYYAFDLVPAYWNQLITHINSGKIVVLDVVKNELIKGNDDLTTWINGLSGLQVISTHDQGTMNCYARVIQYLQTCGFYKFNAVNTWSQVTVADPWLIASAMKNCYTLVTEEKPSGGLNKKQPNSSAKIPDVARGLGVPTIDIFAMMRRLGIVIR